MKLGNYYRTIVSTKAYNMDIFELVFNVDTKWIYYNSLFNIFYTPIFAFKKYEISDVCLYSRRRRYNEST